MFLMYIDESGDTVPLTQKGKRFLVLTGCVIEESDKLLIEKGLREIKLKYYQDPDIEIKSNFLRYANPDLKEKSPIKLNDREKYDQLEVEVSDFLKNLSVSLYSIVIDKPKYWEQYPAQNPYRIAYILLLERFQKFLEEQNGLGICIIDPREGQVEKHYIGKELDDIHNLLRWKDGDFWSRCQNIIEKVLFAASDKTVGIQLADLFCYPIFNIFEYDKKKSEYWRFEKLTYPKLKELKVFPEESKKGLRFYN